MNTPAAITGNKVFRSRLRVPTGHAWLDGNLELPPDAIGLVIFAHGSGSSRHSPRNLFVARQLRNQGLGSLLIDLLTIEEEQIDAYTGALRFDIELLAERLMTITQWLLHEPATRALEMGYFGASTGAAAALMAAADIGPAIFAVVSRGGRADLASDALPLVRSPTLLIVGGNDELVRHLNHSALTQLHCEKCLQVIPGATHLFEEDGALEQVAQLSADWFNQHLRHGI